MFRAGPGMAIVLLVILVSPSIFIGTIMSPEPEGPIEIIAFYIITLHYSNMMLETYLVAVE